MVATRLSAACRYRSRMTPRVGVGGRLPTRPRRPRPRAGDEPDRRPLWVRARHPWRLVVSTVSACLRNRVTGLAAEAAFFALLSLPPLIFGLAGSIGYVVQRFTDQRIGEFKSDVVELASQAFTDDTVQKIIVPDDERRPRRAALRRHLDRLHPRAVVGLTGAQRLRRHRDDHVRPRGPPRHRAHPGAVVLALRARAAHRHRHDPAGRRRARAGRPDPPPAASTPSTRSTGRLVVAMCICFTATLYHVSVPVRTSWRYNLPGAR